MITYEFGHTVTQVKKRVLEQVIDVTQAIGGAAKLPVTNHIEVYLIAKNVVGKIS